MARLLVLASIFATGCTLAVSLDGLAGPPVIAGDGGVDATSAVDGAPTDAGTEAAVAVVGCARFPDAAFCQDFDDPKTALAPASWSDPPLDTTRGSASLVSEGASSAPNAVRLALTTTPTDCEYVQLSRSFADRFSALTTKVSARIDSGGAFLAVIAAPSSRSGPTYRVLLALADTKDGVYAAVQKHLNGNFTDFSSQTLVLTTPPIGRDLALSVELTGAPTPSVKLREGSQVLDLPAPSDLVIEDALVQIGPYCLGRPVAFTFDDLVVFTTR